MAATIQIRCMHHSQLLVESFQRLLGRPLVHVKDGATLEETARALWTARHVVVSHGQLPGPEGPVFNYGNGIALQTFEIDWESFTRLPSRYSAEPGPREQRQVMMDKLSRDPHGYITDYTGVRVTAKGRRFRIEDGIIWNVTDKAGVGHGQAATFSQWTWLS